MLRSTLAAAIAFSTAAFAAEPPPYPPYPPPPPPPRYRRLPPPRVVDPNPPPLSPGMRVLYAPFYVTGLVLRYGVYYAVVAPLEVLNRTLTYGVEGGVERPAPPPPPPDHDT